MRQEERMRRPLSSKSSTYTESLSVDAAGISVKVGAHYPGRSDCLPDGLFPPRGGKRDSQKSAEAIVASTTMREGPNMNGGRMPEFRGKTRC
jgi:hypothetical protein